MTYDEFMQHVKDLAGERTDDVALREIDFFSNIFKTINTAQEWEERYNNNDAEWRRRYKERFFSGNYNDDNTNDSQIEGIEDDDNETVIEKRVEDEDIFKEDK